MASTGDAILGSAGLLGTWDSRGAAAAAEGQARNNQQALQNWTDMQGYLGGYSSSLANTDYMRQAQNQYQYQQANYEDQQHAAGMLYNQATGAAPSMADLQMQAGLGQANNAVQSAMLSQQGGVAPGLSQRNMLNAQAAQNAGIVSTGQANRANELSTAQVNYGNLLGNMGQTAAGMTNQQQAFGTQQYNQGITNLGYQTNANNAVQANNTANNTTNYAAQMDNVRGASGANGAQFEAMGNLIAAGAGALANGYSLSPNAVQNRR